MLKQLACVFVVALFAVSAVASTALAQDAQLAGDAHDASSVQVMDQATVVRGTPQRPAAFYVLPRSTRASQPTELRRSFVREVVRSARALR